MRILIESDFVLYALPVAFVLFALFSLLAVRAERKEQRRQWLAAVRVRVQ